MNIEAIADHFDNETASVPRRQGRWQLSIVVLVVVAQCVPSHRARQLGRPCSSL